MTTTTTSKSAKQGWCGCATLSTDEPKLWIVEQTPSADGNIQGFSLAEVLEAGLGLKVVGLADADRDAAIADCVADTLAQLKQI
jgi:hypothetical protein